MNKKKIEICSLTTLKENEEIKNSELNSEQKLIKKLVLKGESVFFTGSAGTGKSFLLKEIITALQKKYGKSKVGITSTTGTGADIIGGTTLASFFGLKTDSHLDKDIIFERIRKHSEHAFNNWRKTKVLIIDEASMLDGDLFDKLEALARDFRINNFPFGSMQLVLVGDFCQLPPVNRDFKYCFQAESWSHCIPNTINLKQIYRQKDGWFISFLEDTRFGRLSQNRWEKLMEWKSKEPNWPNDGIKPINLFATKNEVNGINEKELLNLEGRSYFFDAKDIETERGRLAELTKSLLVPERLELKTGVQVMLVFNWHEQQLVNGSQGVIIGFTDSNSYPIVKFTNGKELVVKEHTWQKIEGYDKNSEPIISATRSQIPLILSWAMTIHKSQGQTIERLRVDLSKCFMNGQVYTALSRISDPKYLQIINFPLNRLWCDWKVREYYGDIIVPEKILGIKHNELII